MDAIQTFKLTKHFNSLVAVNGIDLKIGEGELFALGVILFRRSMAR